MKVFVNDLMAACPHHPKTLARPAPVALNKGNPSTVKVNVTLSLEDEVVRKVRRIAAEKDTTLTGLVPEYLVMLAQSDDTADRKIRERANLERAFERFSMNASPRTWTRAELYERR